MQALAFIGLFWGLLLAAGDGTAAEIEIELRSERDVADIEYTADEAVVSIASSRGIGRATLKPAEGVWPQIRLRLALDDLEGIDVTAGEWKLHSFLGAESTEIERPEGGPEDSDLQLVIRQADDGLIEVELPAALLDMQPEAIEIRWVDHYR